MSIPDLFRCPISLDLFTDPVTLSTGQTYDRPGIEKWLAGGNLTCPVTMQKLHDTSLVPNHTLKHLIDQWLLTGCDLNPHPKPSKPIDSFELSALKQSFQSPDATVTAKLETLRKIRVLSVESDIPCLIHSGFFRLLLETLFQAPWHGNAELMELALECILNLSPSIHVDSLNMLKKESYLASLVLLLEQGSTKIKTSLCYLLEDIATSLATCELCLVLGQTQRVLQALIALLHDKTDAGASEAALRAISSICSLEANRGNAIKEGAVDGLIMYLLNSTQRNVSQALATLELLLGLETGRKALSRNSEAVGLLVKMVFRVSSVQEGSEQAIGSLMILCSESRQMRVEAINSGVLTQLLLLLQSQSSPKAKDKARAFLKLLRVMWNEDQRWL
ncbi:U-box domain-containing protein 26-like [Phoenix dactylifera]|uniref:U-box domain-containing protein n=1 Tax=Phoenix dactylifera TaxID=42345 RepID=A0A8B8JCF6_PHODC|nr:U-box domain-containing protein 26-like [Phoenix dactylifera]XP_038989447.1 U-box domain-containing protein 26-like [Phoenix dactylifera]